MKEYKTTEPITLFAGKIGLSEKLAARRKSLLKKVKKGFYKILGEIQLKAGEVITLDPDKATLARLELTKKGLAQEEAEIQAKFEAEEKAKTQK